MDPLAYALIAAFVILYGVVSNKLESISISGPMVFVAFGFLLSSDVLGLITLKDHVSINLIANLALMLVLFSDASRISLGFLWREQDLPRRLLGIGLPLTIFAGVLLGTLLLTGLPFWQAAVLAAILAPTDAALAQAVINSKRVPQRIRQALNVESGLNDGICLPVLLLFIYLADRSVGDYTVSYWLQFLIFQLVLGPLVGSVIGFFGAKAILWGLNKNWMSPIYQRLSGIALAVTAFYAADLVGGNGFISAFFAGLTTGHIARRVSGPIHKFSRAEEALLILLTFLLFGAVMVPDAIANINWVYILYALLSLTFVRMVPVAVSLIGKKLTFPTILYMGWFGPRGVASILYVLLVVDEYNLSGQKMILDITAITVLLSIFLHGLTAVPGADAYASTLESIPEKEKHAEMQKMHGLSKNRNHMEPDT